MVINTDPSSQQHAIVIVCIVSPIVTSLFVAIRIWTRIFVTNSIGWDDCKLPRLRFSGLALTRQRRCLDYLGKYSHRIVANLLTIFEQPFCIAYSVLIGLGVLVADLLLQARIDQHKTLGTNYGFGWHTADVSPDRYNVYNEVQDSRYFLWPY